MLALAAGACPANAATCCVDGSCVYVGSLSTGTTPLSSLCGHTIKASSGTCTVTMTQDESVASGDCVTLLDSAKLVMNGHTITCTGSSCGKAIDITDQSTALPAVILEGQGYIRGCFTTGVNTANLTYLAGATITDLDVDLANTSLGCQGTDGVGKVDRMTRVVSGNMSGTCINMGAPSRVDVVDSIAHDCGIGIVLGRGGSRATGSLATDNGVNIKTVFTGGTPSVLEDSTVRDASTCNFQDHFGTCVATGSASAPDMIGTNFIDNTIYH
jgi:hypothetical protein